MLTIRTAAQLRGARSVKDFRSCAASTGVPARRGGMPRLFRAETDLEKSEFRRRWLAVQWEAHQARAATSGRPWGGEIGR
jgi:hypothetical protein